MKMEPGADPESCLSSRAASLHHGGEQAVCVKTEIPGNTGISLYAWATLLETRNASKCKFYWFKKKTVLWVGCLPGGVGFQRTYWERPPFERSWVRALHGLEPEGSERAVHPQEHECWLLRA